jgi:hypothetical protein
VRTAHPIADAPADALRGRRSVGSGGRDGSSAHLSENGRGVNGPLRTRTRPFRKPSVVGSNPTFGSIISSVNPPRIMGRGEARSIEAMSASLRGPVRRTLLAKQLAIPPQVANNATTMGELRKQAVSG